MTATRIGTWVARVRTSGIGGRLVWTYGDQALSSIQNAALSVVLARAVDPRQFGAFSIAFTVYGLVVAVSDAVGGSVLVIRFAASVGETRQRATRAATGTAVALGSLAAIGLFVAGVLASGSLRTALVVTAVAFPGLLLQDAWRTVFISRGTPRSAFANDALWLAMQVAGIAVLEVVHSHDVWAYLIAWGAAAGIAAAVGIRQSSARPAPWAAPGFLRQNAGAAGPALGSVVASVGASQVSFLLIAGYGTLGDIGALRGALTLLGPLNVIGFATTAFTVPELVRRGLGRRMLLLVAVAVSLLITGTDAAWGGVLLLLPAHAGHALLGATWPATRRVLPEMVLFLCAVGLTVGPSVVISALNRPARSTAVSLIVSPLTVVLALVGLHLGGARGAAGGFAIAAAVGIVPSWVLAMQASSLGRRPSAGDPVVAPAGV